MGRRVHLDDLVGASEIAARLGVASPQVIHVWRRRHADFPAPVATISQTLIWLWPDVEGWARSTGRLRQ
jgi:predicted DNA-binding transcriptional regulator AlpA